MRALIFAGLVAWSTVGLLATAHSLADASRASMNMSVAIPVALVAGGEQFFRDAGKLSVTGVQTAGSIVTIGLHGASTGAEASVRVAATALEGSAIVSGMALESVATLSGTLLLANGKALLFVPNSMAREMLHHSRAARG